MLSYKLVFDDYVKSALHIERDISFWRHFLHMSIDNYKKENPENRWINKSIFSVYDIPEKTYRAHLVKYNKTLTIEIKDLIDHNHNFFTWIMNLSLSRLYNCIELLLIQSIHLKYFPLFDAPTKGKKETNKIIKALKDELIHANELSNTKNNRHLIAYLKLKSPSYKMFLEKKTEY